MLLKGHFFSFEGCVVLLGEKKENIFQLKMKWLQIQASK
uniref:Uncharacterized protein n=1 Tax=Anguilla anguilla TaxID=7936 RepID=A0A0E9XH04_ANGAN